MTIEHKHAGNGSRMSSQGKEPLARGMTPYNYLAII